MTTIETPPEPVLDPDVVAAASGVLQVNPPLPDPVERQPSALLVMQENPELSLTGENYQIARCCGLQPVRFWIDGCSPTYDVNMEPHKCQASCWASVTFRPFTIYNVDEVPCLNAQVSPEDEARLAVQRGGAWSATRELDHAPGTGNPSLRSQGLDITPNDGAAPPVYSPVGPTQALSMLHATYRDRATGGFVLVVPVEALPFLVERRQAVNRGGIWTTATGIPIIVGPGLTGVAPFYDRAGNLKPGVDTGQVDQHGDPILAPTQAMLDAPSTGVVTFYAMRSVPEYRLGTDRTYGEIMGDAGIQVEHRQNKAAEEAVRQGIIRFDPFCIYGIQVNLSEGACH